MKQVIDYKGLKKGDVISVYLRSLDYACIVSRIEHNDSKFEHNFALYRIEADVVSFGFDYTNVKTLLKYIGNGEFIEFYTNNIINVNYINTETGSYKFDEDYSDLTPEKFMKCCNKFIENPLYITLENSDLDEDGKVYSKVSKEDITQIRYQSKNRDTIIQLINSCTDIAVEKLLTKLDDIVCIDYDEAIAEIEEKEIKKFIYDDENKRA